MALRSTSRLGGMTSWMVVGVATLSVGVASAVLVSHKGDQPVATTVTTTSQVSAPTDSSTTTSPATPSTTAVTTPYRPTTTTYAVWHGGDDNGEGQGGGGEGEGDGE